MLRIFFELVPSLSLPIFVSCAQLISGQCFHSILPSKSPEDHMPSGAPRGNKLRTPSAKWDHYWLTQIWPMPPFHTPLKNQKTKGLPAFPDGHKTGTSARKGSSDKIKTIEDLLHAKMKNKIKWNKMKWKLAQGQISCRLMQRLKINKWINNEINE